MGTVDELIGQLEAGGYHERKYAAEKLGEVRDPIAVPAILQTLKKPQESTDVRAAAAHAIGKIGDWNAIPELLNAYEIHKGFVDVPIVTAVGEILGRTSPDDDRSREVFSNAVNWLIEIAQERDFRSRDFQTLCRMRTTAVEALGQSRDPKVIPALTKQLTDDLCFDDARAAARALRHFNDPQVIEALIQAAGNKNIADGIRLAAVESLTELADPQAVDTLIQIVEDQSEYYQTRREAARALGRIGDPKAIEPLIRTLKSERESVTSEIGAVTADILGEDIAKALGAFRDPRVIDALVKALGYEYHTAYGASESLKKLRDPRTVEPLIRIVEDAGNKGVVYDYRRRFAAEILGVLGDPRAIPALTKAARDGDEKLREAAFESIQPFIPTHPDAILRLPPEDRHFLGRLIQNAQRDELLREVCN
jgi:HEAT repeat protein